MYNGLTIEDEKALLDAKARGAEWVARDASERIMGYSDKPFKAKDFSVWLFDGRIAFDIDEPLLPFIQWSDPDPVNIDLALAQIAEMESAEKPMTWNERINQMTAEEKAEWVKEYLFDAACEGVCMYNGCNGACTENIVAFFNSPYTEGANK